MSIFSQAVYNPTPAPAPYKPPQNPFPQPGQQTERGTITEVRYEFSNNGPASIDISYEPHTYRTIGVSTATGNNHTFEISYNTTSDAPMPRLSASTWTDDIVYATQSASARYWTNTAATQNVYFRAPPAIDNSWTAIKKIGRQDPIAYFNRDLENGRVDFWEEKEAGIWEWRTENLRAPNDDDYRELHQLTASWRERHPLSQQDQEFAERIYNGPRIEMDERWYACHVEQARRQREQQLEARARSMELLMSWLTAKEYKALIETGELEIRSPEEANTVFIVKKDPQAKVVVKQNNQPKEMLCVMPSGFSFADGDVLLSKIMMLKTDPQHFIKLANRYPIQRSS